MRAGQLSETITIQRSTSTVDDYGQAIDAWAPLVTVRAQVIQQSTEEFLRTSGEASETAIVFRIRHRDGFTNGDRIIHDGATYDLKEIRELGRRQGMDLRCVAVGT